MNAGYAGDDEGDYGGGRSGGTGGTGGVWRGDSGRGGVRGGDAGRRPAVPADRRPAPRRPPAQPGWQPQGEGGGYAPGDEDWAGDRFVPGFGDDRPGDDWPGDGGSGGGDGGYGKRRRRGGTDEDDDARGRGADGRGRGGSGGSKGRARWIAPVIALLVIVVPLGAGGLYAYSYVQNKYHPADYSGSGTGPAVVVQVKSGDTATSLAPRLLSRGVIASDRAFVLAAEHSSNTAGLEAGFYRLSRRMQASIAYQQLLNPADRVQVTITFPEGLRAAQVANVLGDRTGIPLAGFQHVLADPAQLGLPSYAGGKPEGYLFPATYQIQPNATALSVLQAMVQRFDQEAAAINLPAAAARLHLTSTQLMTVASLVQAEGGRVSDYPKIAAVVYNRLAKGMKLQFDSTVFYGLGLFGTAATDGEINTPGPYNTYLNQGLPPGPIDCPGNAAIEGALRPARADYLYFVSFRNGESEFSATPLPGQG